MYAREKRPLERSGVRYNLIRSLAEGTVTQASLAEKYNVTEAAISHFRKRHADRIEAVRADLNNELAGIWVAEKKQRLDALMADVELCERLLDSGSPGEDEPPRTLDPAWARVKQAALRAVAEELGQIPNRAGPAAPTDVTFTLKIPRPDPDSELEVSMTTTTETTVDIEGTSP